MNTEVMPLFPSEYIHIGGDEAPKVQCEERKLAQQVIEREGLEDKHELRRHNLFWVPRPMCELNICKAARKLNIWPIPASLPWRRSRGRPKKKGLESFLGAPADLI